MLSLLDTRHLGMTLFIINQRKQVHLSAATSCVGFIFAAGHQVIFDLSSVRVEETLVCHGITRHISCLYSLIDDTYCVY